RGPPGGALPPSPPPAGLDVAGGIRGDVGAVVEVTVEEEGLPAEGDHAPEGSDPPHGLPPGADPPAAVGRVPPRHEALPPLDRPPPARRDPGVHELPAELGEAIPRGEVLLP